MALDPEKEQKRNLAVLRGNRHEKEGGGPEQTGGVWLNMLLSRPTRLPSRRRCVYVRKMTQCTITRQKLSGLCVI